MECQCNKCSEPDIVGDLNAELEIVRRMYRQRPAQIFANDRQRAERLEEERRLWQQYADIYGFGPRQNQP